MVYGIVPRTSSCGTTLGSARSSYLWYAPVASSKRSLRPAPGLQPGRSTGAYVVRVPQRSEEHEHTHWNAPSCFGLRCRFGPPEPRHWRALVAWVAAHPSRITDWGVMPALTGLCTIILLFAVSEGHRDSKLPENLRKSDWLTDANTACRGGRRCRFSIVGS